MKCRLCFGHASGRERVIDLPDDVKQFMTQAISPIFDACGNSYSNAWCEELLTTAKRYGIYPGETIGKIIDLDQAWEAYLEGKF
jgi:hypothetical protein